MKGLLRLTPSPPPNHHVIMSLFALLPPPHVIECHDLAYPLPPICMTSLMNGPLFLILKCNCYDFQNNLANTVRLNNSGQKQRPHNSFLFTSIEFGQAFGVS